MKDFINTLYKNHSLAYKVLLFFSTTFLIVYLFPKSGKFKYNFDKGKPWQSENLYAPFDFAIKKSAEELEKEQMDISQNVPVYFEIAPNVKEKVLEAYPETFNKWIPDSIIKKGDNIFDYGKTILERLYVYGVLDEDYNYPKDKNVILIENQTQKESTVFSNFTSLNSYSVIVKQELEKAGFSKYAPNLISVYFDIIKPNVKINKSLTENSLKEELDNISPMRGSIEKGTLIISKGEIVEGSKYDILKSLQSEYESQVWTKSSYNWIVFAYTLLVALTLLMLLLFLRKYRIEVFMDNTKVTFIFFNILLMILLTTLVINFNSKYVYVVPLCVLPLVFKAFFDARLGLFAHITGSIGIHKLLQLMRRLCN